MTNARYLRPLPPPAPASRLERIAAGATYAASIATALFALIQAIA